MMKPACLLSMILAAAAVQPAIAQQRPIPPFIGRGATAFDPEIDALNSGAVLEAQPVVSHDLKYVTITMRG